MPARRDETALRARQGSAVAKRRPQNQHRKRRHRSDRRQRRRKLPDNLDQPKGQERLRRLQQRLSSGAAAAVDGAEGDVHRGKYTMAWSRGGVRRRTT